MKQIIGILCFVMAGLISVSAHAAQPAAPNSDTPTAVIADVPDTLMFTIDELNEIQGRIGMGGEGAGDQQLSPIEDATLYLSTIVYYAPDDWTAWINDVPITSRQEIRSFEVTDITPSYIELLVPLSAQGMRPVRLSPNQTFIAKSGAVVEGRWTR